MEPREFTLVNGEQFLKLWDPMNITLFWTLTLTGRANKGQDFFLWVQFTLTENTRTAGQGETTRPEVAQGDWWR